MKFVLTTLPALLLMFSVATTGCYPKKEKISQEPALPVNVVKADAPVVPVSDPSKEVALPPTKIKWETQKKDFGKVAIKEGLTHTFYVTNTGTEPLKLVRVKPSCSCTASDYTKEMIAPGERGKITATFTPKAAGNFTKTITVTTNTPERNTVLTLSGEGAA